MAWGKKPVVVDPCLVCNERHEYHKMDCEKQFKTHGLDWSAKLEALKKASIDLHISPEKLQEVSQRNIEIVTWLRGLCIDWNAGAICQKKYQEKKDKCFTAFLELGRLTSEAEEVKKGATMGAGGSEKLTIKEFEGHLDEYIKRLKELEP